MHYTANCCSATDHINAPMIYLFTQNLAVHFFKVCNKLTFITGPQKMTFIFKIDLQTGPYVKYWSLKKTFKIIKGLLKCLSHSALVFKMTYIQHRSSNWLLREILVFEKTFKIMTGLLKWLSHLALVFKLTYIYHRSSNILA